MIKEEYSSLTTSMQKLFQNAVNRAKKGISKKPKLVHKAKIEIVKKKYWECKLCNMWFDTNSGLGGHMSMVHPGESKAFNYMKEVRAKRELERQLHKEAMTIYKEQSICRPS